MATRKAVTPKAATPKAVAAEIVSAKPGRPAKEITDTHLSIVQHGASLGLTLDQISLLCDVSPSTLDRWLKLDEVNYAYKKGRAIALQQMSQTLWDLAMAGELGAVIFWLKSQAGWSDRLTIKQETPTEANQVHIYLPDNGR